MKITEDLSTDELVNVLFFIEIILKQLIIWEETFLGYY